MSNITGGRQCRAITSPTANQHAAISTGARRNASGSTGAAARGHNLAQSRSREERSSDFSVFTTLPADRLPSIHNTRGYLRNTITVSRWYVWGNRSNKWASANLYPCPTSTFRSRASVTGSHET